MSPSFDFMAILLVTIAAIIAGLLVVLLIQARAPGESGDQPSTLTCQRFGDC